MWSERSQKKYILWFYLHVGLGQDREIAAWSFECWWWTGRGRKGTFCGTVSVTCLDMGDAYTDGTFGKISEPVHLSCVQVSYVDYLPVKDVPLIGKNLPVTMITYIRRRVSLDIRTLTADSPHNDLLF